MKLDYLAYCIIDEKQNKYLYFGLHPFEKIYNFYFLQNVLRTKFLEEELLNKPFGKIKIGISNNRSTLVPNSLFDNNNVADLLKFNHSIASNEKVLTDDIPSIGSKNVWSIDGEIIDLLTTQFSSPLICHSSTPLVESLINENKAQHEAKLFVNVHLNIIELVYIDKGKLLLYNSSSFTTQEDFIYHILFTCEQLDIKPDTIKLILLGEIEKTSPIFEIIYKYIRNVSFGKRPMAYLYSSTFAKAPEHFYYNSFSLNVCE